MNPAQLLAHFDRISEAPDAIPRLRRFILDLAVRGKLVEQDPRDEPASELLRRIQAEKARLAKSGEIKNLEAFTPVGANEIPFPIPTDWEVVRMGWLARKLGAGSTPLGGKSVYQSEGVPFLRSQNVHDDGLRLDDVALISCAIHDRMSGTHVQRQDILLNITGASIGRCALVPSTFAEGNVSQHVAIIRLFLPSIREFIHLSLTSQFFQKVIDDVQVGVSREGLSMQRLRLFPMLIPPLTEQHRIVAKVDELMALCDRLEAAQAKRESRRDRLVVASLHRLNNGADAEELRSHACFYLNHLPRLSACPAHIRQLRQTILSLAVRGRLVPQDPSDEPTSELFRRVQAEKARLAKSGNLRGDTRVTPLGADAGPYGLPSSWARVSLGDITVSRDGERIPVSKEERNRRANTYEYYGASGVIDKIDGYLFDKPLLLIGEDGANLINRSTPIAFIARGKYWVNNHAHVLDAISEDFLRFIEFHVNAIDLKPYVTGTAQPKMNQAKMNSIPIAVPPLAEQRRIVAKVDELMVLCDLLEAQLTTAQTRSRRLIESILHQTLNGDTD